jgi:myo-inositol 2-dehydrogenase/D-chiro-inositol 1-dehydrogenase
MKQPSSLHHAVTRRDFLKSTSTVVGGSLLGSLAVERAALAAATDTLKLALIGCGNRGAGAADQALSTPGPLKLVAMADAFDNRLQSSAELLKQKHGAKVEVPKEHQFVGLDGFNQAMALADVVILAAPPGFRPEHYEAAVRQGKHVFMEKPVATDAPGIRRVLAANEDAKKKNLKVGVGFQRHHKPGYLETVRRIQDGALGDIHTMRCYWRGTSRGGLAREAGETEMQYQIRNWYFFTWLSGDHIVEQHCHNIDVCNWIKGAHPIRASGLGGRQVRTSKEHGQIFDHHFVEFEYEDGTRMFSECSQIPRIWHTVTEHVQGTKGRADLANDRNGFAITGASPWHYRSQKGDNPYQLEHDDLFDAIRNNKTYNEAEYGAYSTMTAILGRMATYSGELVEWEEAFNSKLELVPKSLTWNSTPPVLPKADGFYPVAMPGSTVAW